MREHAKFCSLFWVMPRQFTPGKAFLKHKKHWFPAKRHGWGWGFPICWEGKAVTLIYLISMTQSAKFIESAPHVTLAMMGGATMWLVGICWWKGEKPQWRWGKD